MYHIYSDAVLKLVLRGCEVFAVSGEASRTFLIYIFFHYLCISLFMPLAPIYEFFKLDFSYILDFSS